MLGETVFAELREGFLERVLRLPLSTVERAGTGDLVTRSTGDIEARPAPCASPCPRCSSPS